MDDWCQRIVNFVFLSQMVWTANTDCRVTQRKIKIVVTVFEMFSQRIQKQFKGKKSYFHYSVVGAMLVLFISFC